MKELCHIVATPLRSEISFNVPSLMRSWSGLLMPSVRTAADSPPYISLVPLVPKFFQRLLVLHIA